MPSQHYFIKDHDIYSGSTIGVSVFPNDGEDTAVLMRNAGIAMYQAKPWDDEELFDHIRKAIYYYHLSVTLAIANGS